MKTVLIVEDDAELCKGYAEFLSSDYKVICAGNGKEALRKFKKENVDFVVLDLIIPDMNGEEALKKMKEINANVKIMILTAVMDPNLEKTMLSRGATVFYRKPIMGKDLMAEIKKHIPD